MLLYLLSAWIITRNDIIMTIPKCIPKSRIVLSLAEECTSFENTYFGLGSFFVGTGVK